MKHNMKITWILISMFIVTQLIGLFVISVYNNPNIELPYGFETPPEIQEEFSVFHIIFAFIVALTLFFILTKLKAETFIRIWFFIITILAIALTLNAAFLKLTLLSYTALIAIAIAIPLAYIKIFNRNILVHNLTELLIYPGIAAVFIPILNVMGIIIFLLLISLYDIWAVWHSSFMKNMAKYQIENLKIFTGFFVPYATKNQRTKIQKIKQKYAKKSKKFLEKQFEKAKIKISLAILGGGDVIFPIIAAGVFYSVYHSLIPALIIAASATIALLGLFILARKGKFYPAMPFLTIGIYLGMILDWILMIYGII